MNLFQSILLNIILLIFPLLIYLIYLFTDKNVNKKNQDMFFILSILTSFFLTLKYGNSEFKIIQALILNCLVILSFLKDKNIIGNILSILIIYIYKDYFNNIYFLLTMYIAFNVLYLFKNKLNGIIYLELSIFISSMLYFLWIYLYNIHYYDIKYIFLTFLCYILITNIVYIMYDIGSNILDTFMDYKDLQKEKQIRLSLFKITHEIKNPIAVCKCYLDMINPNDNTQVIKYIPIIKSEIDRILIILEDFLYLNKQNLDMNIMDINVLIEDTLEKIKPILKYKNIKINLNINDDELYINGDYNRLSQALINILKNSIESIEKEGIIKISTIKLLDEYIIEIEDNGIGIKKDIIDKIKTPFFTTKKGGTGLGVPLIYEIVSAHNGTVNYSSVYGKGTKVKLEFLKYK